MTKCKFIKLLFVFLVLFFINIIGVKAACTGIRIEGLQSKDIKVNQKETLHTELYGCVDNNSYTDWYIVTPKLGKFVNSSTKKATITDSKITEVNGAGNITFQALATGTLKIKACLHGKSDNGSCHEINIIVVSTKCESIEIKGMDNKISRGESENIHVAINDCVDSSSYIDWFVDSPDMGKIVSASSGTVASDGLSATSVKGSGNIKITVANKDGQFYIRACLHGTDICQGGNIAVGSAEKSDIKSLTIEGKQDRAINVGQSEIVHVNPNWNGAHVFNGESGGEDEIVWTSSNTKVAIVVNNNDNKQGKVTGVSTGTATIKACVATNMNVCGSIRFTVKGKNTRTDQEAEGASLKFDKSSSTIAVGDSERFDIKFTEVKSSRILDEDGITLVPTITGPASSDIRNGSINNRVINSTNGCLTASTDLKGAVLITANKECGGTVSVKACLSSKPNTCTQNLSITVSGTVNNHINSNGTYKSLAGAFNVGSNGANGTGDCKALLDANLTEIIRTVMKVIQIATPILLVIFVTIDFGGVVIAGNPNDKHRDSLGDTYDDAMKRAVSRTVKRVIAAIVIFFIPVLVRLLLNAPAISETANPNCVDVFTED